jgi:hypothetical protein
VLTLFNKGFDNGTAELARASGDSDDSHDVGVCEKVWLFEVWVVRE